MHSAPEPHRFSASDLGTRPVWLPAHRRPQGPRRTGSGRRISASIPAGAPTAKAGLLSPKKLAEAEWQQLVDLLGAGAYKRYDESTARELIQLGNDAMQNYHGRLSRITDGDDGKSAAKAEIKSRVQEFKGIGPTAADIFVRELQL
jgi:hypothetical protein